MLWIEKLWTLLLWRSNLIQHVLASSVWVHKLLLILLILELLLLLLLWIIIRLWWKRLWWCLSLKLLLLQILIYSLIIVQIPCHHHWVIGLLISLNHRHLRVSLKRRHILIWWILLIRSLSHILRWINWHLLLYLRGLPYWSRHLNFLLAKLHLLHSIRVHLLEI